MVIDIAGKTITRQTNSLKQQEPSDVNLVVYSLFNLPYSFFIKSSTR